MWTRKAFIDICSRQSRTRRLVCFLDLDGLGELNLSLGYTEVDRRVKKTFAGLSTGSDIAARWYSGDEIVILFESGKPVAPKIRSLLAAAQGQGISFTLELSSWLPGQCAISTLVDEMSSKIAFRKNQLHQDKKEYGSERLTNRYVDWAVQPQNILR
jgi:GGDEF domain-containing protein